MRRPNVVVCLCDQLRAFEVGCYGNPVIHTPHMDRLAAEGIRFEHAVTNYPVCMAARSVLLSGQYNRTCTGGVSNVAYPTKPGDVAMPEYPEHGRPHLPAPTLAEILQHAGYRTTAIGKWHIHSWPQDVGFERYCIPRVHHCHTAQCFTENGGPEFVPAGFSVDYEADRVEQYLEEMASTDEPFFLDYNISPPHCPLADAPERILAIYPPDEVPIRGNVDLTRTLAGQEYWFRVYRYDFRYYSFQLPYTEELPDGYDLRWLIAEYYGLTTWADEALGRMLDALDRHGLEQNTIVVFASDHGDNLGSHGLVQKGTPNEESLRIPFIIRLPDGPRGEVRNEIVASLVDVAPTILSLVGLPVPNTMQGRDVSASVHGNPLRAMQDYAIAEMGHGLAIRTPRHLCFVPYREGTRLLADASTMLYDLHTDPLELTNLAGVPELHDVEVELTSRIREWDVQTPWMGRSTSDDNST